ncbi:hypothetical protein ACIBH1_45765 [Nonomuraea sp. NPDC050663]|uniref:hypothetical protein n=1 Tax=Nonomuraea sp. NPDC050663 TaxID=3364370 RepID=UPI00379598E2
MEHDTREDWRIAAERMAGASTETSAETGGMSAHAGGFTSAEQMAERYGVDPAVVHRKAAALRLLLSSKTA